MGFVTDAGCIAVTTPYLRHFAGLAAVFPSAYLARISVSLSPLKPGFDYICSRHITPLTLNMHSRATQPLPDHGTFNLHGQCSVPLVGNIYNLPVIPRNTTDDSREDPKMPEEPVNTRQIPPMSPECGPASDDFT